MQVTGETLERAMAVLEGHITGPEQPDPTDHACAPSGSDESPDSDARSGSAASSPTTSSSAPASPPASAEPVADRPTAEESPRPQRRPHLRSL